MGGEQEEVQKGIAKEHKETFGDDQSVYYFDDYYGYIYIYIYVKKSNYIFELCAVN